MRQFKDSASANLFRRELAWEKQFYDAGGLLVAGTDPTVADEPSPASANYREIELLVEVGSRSPPAIKICTLNGALYLNRGKRDRHACPGQACRSLLINGDISKDIHAIRHTEIVFKDG